ncbi:divergent polysaccharide deacetylase family protein [Nitratireductor mangrovi]|uniref:Divergent polysaccharide deacetylase family protein n=1 Tax=Nitratireductor mangrovi TaxID=2599600 RepID=A0A5B8KW22_9HYPH|nr:divergent polysaccharide deacetylase family protein [Nitratireductor mangrovi]
MRGPSLPVSRFDRIACHSGEALSLPLDKQIERPLGQDRPAREVAPRAAGMLPGPGRVGGVLLAGAVLAAGGVIALQPAPWRQPEPEVASTPADQPAPQPKELATNTEPPERTAPAAPSIIRVPDEDSSQNVIVIRDPSALGQDLRVAHLPDRALLEQSAHGPLPIRGADGRRPVDVYARPWSGARGARVAIVIGGLALSQTGTQAAIDKLPPEVTLAFSPQGNSIGRWMQAARRQGHELLMQLPLEPFDYPNINPGRSTLTTQATAGQNIDNLHFVLARTTNYVGVMNYMGARFTADRDSFAPVMRELGARGLLYLDDGTSARSLANDLATASRVPYAQGDTPIDQERERGKILEKLDELERTARARGFALGTGSAFDVTIDAVTSWVAEAKRRGIEIVPVSALANDPEKE